MTEPIDVKADYDGNGREDEAFWTPDTGLWRITLPSGPLEVQHGAKGDLPVPGDYESVGRAQIAVVRKSDQRLVIKDSAPKDWPRLDYRPVAADVPGILALARTARTIAHRLHVKGRYAEAAEVARVERDLYRKLAETPGYEQYLHQWGDAAVWLGGNLGLAQQTAEGAVAAYEGLDVLRRLGNDYLPAGAYGTLAGIFHQGRRYSEAVPPGVRRVEILRALGKQAELVEALCVLSGNLSLSARVADSITTAREALRVANELGETPPKAMANDVLAQRYVLPGGPGWAAAEPHARDAVTLYEQLFGQDPGKYRIPFGHVLSRYSGVLSGLGKHGEAVANAQRSIEIWAPAGNRDLDANAHAHLARVLEVANRLPEAEDPARRAFELYEQLLRATGNEVYRPLLADSVYRYARALATHNREAAKQPAKRALDEYTVLAQRNSAYEDARRRAEEFYRSL